MTLAELDCGGWRSHAVVLTASSRAGYAWALEKHLRELLDEPLVSIDVPCLAGHQALMLDRGASPRTVREVMVRLSGVLEIAAEHGHIASNPVRTLHKPRLEAGEEVDPLSAVKLERPRPRAGTRCGTASRSRSTVASATPSAVGIR